MQNNGKNLDPSERWLELEEQDSSPYPRNEISQADIDSGSKKSDNLAVEDTRINESQAEALTQESNSNETDLPSDQMQSSEQKQETAFQDSGTPRKKLLIGGGIAGSIAALAATAVIFGASAEQDDGTVDENQKTEEEYSDSNSVTNTELDDETISSFSKVTAAAVWEADAIATKGPEGNEATHNVISTIKEDLITKISTARHAESSQERELASRIQVLHGSTYLIDTGESIKAVEDPIIVGLRQEASQTISASFDAKNPNRRNFMLLYLENDEWKSFTLDEKNDARWFSDRGDYLTGVIYQTHGPQVIEGNFVQESLQNEASPIVISLGDAGNVSLDGNIEKYDSLLEAAKATLDSQSSEAGDLRQITTDILNSR